MTAKHRLARWLSWVGAFGITGAALLMAQRTAKQEAIEAMLGEHAQAEAMRLFPRAGLGRLDRVQLPLTTSPSGATSTAAAHHPDSSTTAGTLAAERLWFSYDLAALLKRRFVFPRVVMEEVDLTLAPSPSKAAWHLASSPAWLESLQRMNVSLEQPEYLQSMEVMRELDTLAARWRESFSQVQLRADAIGEEAKRLHRELNSVDNGLRNEKKLTESILQLQDWSREVDALRIDVTHSVSLLQVDRRQVLQLLLKDKEALLDQREAYTSPAADEFAAAVVLDCMQAYWSSQSENIQHVATFLKHPFLLNPPRRGEFLEHTANSLPRAAVYDAKLSGTVSGRHEARPFTASAKFQLAGYSRPVIRRSQNQLSQGDVATSDTPAQNAQAVEATDSLAAERAEPVDDSSLRSSVYQLSIGDPLVPIVLSGKLTMSDSGSEEIAYRLEDPAYGSGEFRESDSKLSGSFQFRLKAWLEQHRDFIPDTLTVAAWQDRHTAAHMVRTSFVSLETVPETISVRVTGSAQEPKFEIEADAVGWLSEALQRQATEQVRARYASASESLESSAQQTLNDLQRNVAVARNEAEQRLIRLRTELDRIRVETERQFLDTTQINVVRLPNGKSNL